MISSPGRSSLVKSSAAPTLGYIAVGVSAFALLASGPRLLSSETYSDLAVWWTVATVFGAGLAVPAEQAINRAVASDESQAANRVSRRVVTITATASAATFIGAVLFSITTDRPSAWPLAGVVAFIGWGLAAVSRGQLAGQGDFAGLGLSLTAEAATRAFLVGVAWMLPNQRVPVLGLAIGLPLVFSWLSTRRRGRRPLRLQSTEPTGQQDAQIAMTVVAFAFQVILNGAPIWLAIAPAVDPQTAGQFVSLASYLRIPMLVMGGLLTVLLSLGSATVAQRSFDEARRRVRRALILALASSSALTAILIGFSATGMRIMYGPNFPSSLPVSIVLGASTIAVIVGNTATQGLFAQRRQRHAAHVWGAGAVITTSGLAVGPPSLMWAATSVFLGGGVATVFAVTATGAFSLGTKKN